MANERQSAFWYGIMSGIFLFAMFAYIESLKDGASNA